MDETVVATQAIEQTITADQEDPEHDQHVVVVEREAGSEPDLDQCDDDNDDQNDNEYDTNDDFDHTKQEIEYDQTSRQATDDLDYIIIAEAVQVCVSVTTDQLLTRSPHPHRSHSIAASFATDVSILSTK